MNIEAFDKMDATGAKVQLQRCCGATRWVQGMLERRPFQSKQAVLDAADMVWSGLDSSDWREAFQHHPRIGDVAGLREKFASTAVWAKGEQAATALADEATLQALAEGNRQYEARFGFIFIVCATGKTAVEMLNLLRGRLQNQPEKEGAIAAAEQHKITRLRLEKLFEEAL
ncbi:MAG: 2-oxo-4-hydroxy-4-carboxy-5-ureidoimidazoline decarboxylase [Candidatus Sericytochromatia bacterium]|nr:2-oxo-4-hydroxy-4-carboxy-5-ureidoimidazoline decarboxylase [Candidatus Sericytochromatia bacterium]